jgi:hypothetical protein
MPGPKVKEVTKALVALAQRRALGLVPEQTKPLALSVLHRFAAFNIRTVG